MPRDLTTTERTVYRCVDPFSPAAKPGEAPRVYSAGSEVLGTDPILKTHRSHFRPSADLIEQATAAPGELRSVVPPTITDDNEQEADNG
jgi:hypothetical protein